MQRLDGKVAVVLGASAEGGTGWGVAEGLAAAGAKVVVGARSMAPLERLADRIGGFAVACDGGDEAQIKALRDAAIDRYRRIDIAVNCAATPVMSSIASVTSEQLQLAAGVNFFGMTWFVRDMAEVMTDGGSIVLVSSMSTTHPVLPHFAYACAKAAAECLVRYAAVEYGPRGIRVNGLRIGTVMSDMARELYNAPGVAVQFIKEIPLGRLGEPEDMADAVLWLSGRAYITGSMIDVSGGNQLNRFPFLSELPGGETNYEGAAALHDREQGRGHKLGG